MQTGRLISTGLTCPIFLPIYIIIISPSLQQSCLARQRIDRIDGLQIRPGNSTLSPLFPASVLYVLGFCSLLKKTTGPSTCFKKGTGNVTGRGISKASVHCVTSQRAHFYDGLAGEALPQKWRRRMKETEELYRDNPLQGRSC